MKFTVAKTTFSSAQFALYIYILHKLELAGILRIITKTLNSPLFKNNPLPLAIADIYIHILDGLYLYEVYCDDERCYLKKSNTPEDLNISKDITQNFASN